MLERCRRLRYAALAVAVVAVALALLRPSAARADTAIVCSAAGGCIGVAVDPAIADDAEGRQRPPAGALLDPSGPSGSVIVQEERSSGSLGVPPVSERPLALVAVDRSPSATAGGAGSGAVIVTQRNRQFAQNVAVNCPGITQTITQVGANVTEVAAASDTLVSLRQENEQEAENIAINSPGARQTIIQIGSNTANRGQVSVSADTRLTVSQSNSQRAQNVAIASPGAVQTIIQIADNSAPVPAPPPPPVTVQVARDAAPVAAAAASATTVNQENTAVAQNTCVQS